MRIRVVAVGKIRDGFAALATEFEARAGRYWKLTVEEVRAGGATATPDAVRRDEAARLLAKCGRSTAIWLITRDGQAITSQDLASRLAERALHSESEIALLIGGAFGFDGSVGDRATSRLSLSSLTFPHELARVLVLEQLYRAGTILRGEPYHKGPKS